MFVILSILFLLGVQLGLVEFFITGINSFHTTSLLFVLVLSGKWSAFCKKTSWSKVWILTHSDNEEYSVLVLLVQTNSLWKAAEIQVKTKFVSDRQRDFVHTQKCEFLALPWLVALLPTKGPVIFLPSHN